MEVEAYRVANFQCLEMVIRVRDLSLEIVTKHEGMSSAWTSG